MEYRPLGRTGVKVSALCLGCMMFGGRTAPEDSYGIIDRALDAGINFIDTANVYSRGRSEEVTGEALKRNGKRAATSCWRRRCTAQMGDEDPNAQGNTRRHIIEQCDASLRRLQTDYIDLYQIHRPEPEHPDRRDAARARRPDPRGQGALHRHQHLRRVAARRVAVGGEGAGAEPLHLRAAAVQPARPPDRARAAADGADVRLRGDPVEPARRRAADAASTSAAKSRRRARASPMRRTRMYRRRLNDRIYDVVDGLQRDGGSEGLHAVAARARLGDAAAGRHRRRSSARARWSSSKTTWARSTSRSRTTTRKQIDRSRGAAQSVAPFYEAEFGPHPYRVS